MKWLGRLLIGIVITVQASVFLTSSTAADFIDTIFQPSKNLDQVLDMGNSTQSVGNNVFRGGIGRSLKDGLTSDAPLLVRITKILLRITIALAVPVLIFVGVKIIKNGLSGGDFKSGLKEVSGVLIGLVLALSAVGIIYLIQSLVFHTLPL